MIIFLKIIGAFVGYGWAWTFRKPQDKTAPVKQESTGPKGPKPPVLGGGRAEVKVVSEANGYAWLKQPGTNKPDIFVSLQVATAYGFKTLKVGQVFEVKWGKSASARKPHRLDAISLVAVQK